MAADDVTSIAKIIEDLSSSTASIASAVEEQHAATEEINRAIGCAAGSANALSTNVATVAETAGRSRGEAQIVLQATKDVDARFNSLRTKIQTFLGSVRTAN